MRNSQHKSFRDSLENLKQENILVPLSDCSCFSYTNIFMANYSPLFYTLNVRRPGVESIAWSHFSTKAHVLRPLWDYGKWLEVGLLLQAWTCWCQGGSMFKYYSQVGQTALSQLSIKPGLIKEAAMETFSCM